jgi:hypothetical protein
MVAPDVLQPPGRDIQARRVNGQQLRHQSRAPSQKGSQDRIDEAGRRAQDSIGPRGRHRLVDHHVIRIGTVQQLG